MSIRGLLAILGFLLLISSLFFFFWWKTHGYVLYGNLIQISALIAAAVFMTRATVAAADRGALWKPWSWISGGAWMWVLGQLWEALAELVLNMTAYGTVADAFWVVGMTMYLIGLTGIMKEQFRLGLPLRGRSVALMTVLLAGLLLVLLLRQRISSPDRDALRNMLDVVYAVLNLGIVFCSLTLFFSNRMKSVLYSQAWGVFAISFAMGTALDAVWGFYSETNSLQYRLQDLTYFVNFSVLAVSALMHQKYQEKQGTEPP